MKIVLHLVVDGARRARRVTSVTLVVATMLYFALSVFETVQSGRFDEVPFVGGVLGLSFAHVVVQLRLGRRRPGVTVPFFRR